MASSLPRAAAAVLVAVAVVGWWSGRNAVVEAAPAGDDRPQAETIGVGGDQDQVLVDVNEWPVNGRGDIVQLWPEAELYIF
jgi:hypothetical protein